MEFIIRSIGLGSWGEGSLVLFKIKKCCLSSINPIQSLLNLLVNILKKLGLLVFVLMDQGEKDRVRWFSGKQTGRVCYFK